MCFNKPECQRCETCGNLKYQLWMSREMHERGCPWGFDRLDRCPDAVNSAKWAFWAREHGVNMLPAGLAKIDQMIAMGVDLTRPPEDWTPENAA